jgi:hypothetical protein
MPVTSKEEFSEKMSRQSLRSFASKKAGQILEQKGKDFFNGGTSDVDPENCNTMLQLLIMAGADPEEIKLDMLAGKMLERIRDAFTH